jgi:hypothetical protein
MLLDAMSRGKAASVSEAQPQCTHTQPLLSRPLASHRHHFIPEGNSPASISSGKAKQKPATHGCYNVNRIDT